MKKIGFFGLLLVFLTACNKDQAAVKKLDGEWKATSYKEIEGGTSEELLTEENDLEFSIFFDNCKLKKEEFCNSTWTFSDGEDSESFAYEYRVTGEGEDIELRDPSDPSLLEVIQIDELTKTSLKLTILYDEEDRDEITFEKSE